MNRKKISLLALLGILGKVGRLSAKNDSAEWFLEDTLEQIAWEDLGVDRGGLGYPFPLKFCFIFIEK